MQHSASGEFGVSWRGPCIMARSRCTRRSHGGRSDASESNMLAICVAKGDMTVMHCKVRELEDQGKMYRKEHRMKTW